jgi:hypothetical protein
MNTLFPVEPVYPPGFSYFTAFISGEEERLLLAFIQAIDLHPMQFQGYTALRKVRSFLPRSIINWHRDAPPFDRIAGISLLSDVTFKPRPHDKAKQNRKTTVSFLVERRSLYSTGRSAHRLAA